MRGDNSETRIIDVLMCFLIGTFLSYGLPNFTVSFIHSFSFLGLFNSAPIRKQYCPLSTAPRTDKVLGEKRWHAIKTDSLSSFNQSLFFFTLFYLLNAVLVLPYFISKGTNCLLYMIQVETLLLIPVVLSFWKSPCLSWSIERYCVASVHWFIQPTRHSILFEYLMCACLRALQMGGWMGAWPHPQSKRSLMWK